MALDMRFLYRLLLWRALKFIGEAKSQYEGLPWSFRQIRHCLASD